MHHPFKVVSLLLVLATSGAVYADNVDDYIKAEMHHRHIPGLSLAVIKDGMIVKVKGYGLANVETATPATPETVYKIGSISKQFLAAGILLLVDEGKIGLDDTVSRFLENTPEAWKEITVRHLLTHTAGLAEDPAGFEPFKVLPDVEVIKTAYAQPLLFAPGEKWSYSNLGYFVLGEIIRKVTGKPWDQYLNERFFAPVGMTATRATTTTEIVPRRASGYNWNRDRLENAENWVAVRPSGAFLSTVLDMVKWDRALSDNTVLKPSLREQMWVPVKLNNGTTHAYGLGWFLDPWQGHKRVYHQGGLPGFVSDIERFMDDKLTVIVLTNTTGADPQKIALNVAGYYAPALAPPLDKPLPETEPEIATKFRVLIQGFVSGKVDRSLFAAEVVARVTPELIGRAREDLRNPGAIQSIVLIERRNEGGNRLYRYRLAYRNYSLVVRCGFDKNDRVIGFNISP